MYKVETKIITVAARVDYTLEGDDILLSYDGGEEYKSTDHITVNGELDLYMRVKGINGSGWKIEVVVTDPNDDDFKKEYKKDGEIERRGYYKLNEKIDLTKEENKDED